MIEEVQIETIIPRPNRSERIQRSEAARVRRKNMKKVKSNHQFKEELDARQRILAKRNLEKQAKKS